VSTATTRGIRVEVASFYDHERSSPAERQYLFTYRVRITNDGAESAQLLSRRWVITDAEGQAQVVSGPGVVGEQPVLAPGQSFEYASFCPLTTPVGAMQGSYQMLLRDGTTFEAEIAPFSLAVPGTIN
jgi:ApaG protein